MDMLIGYSLYAISLLTVGGIYAILALGLNIQWGYAGLFNAGIAGFAAVGAYTFALLSTGPSAYHYGGLGVPLPLAILAAMLLSGFVALVIGLVCIRLRSDYLAIATIGIAEIIKLFLKNETDLTNGPRGINKIPRPWEHLSEERYYTSAPMSWINDATGWDRFFDQLPNWWWQPFFCGSILILVYLIYRLLETAQRSPWGRMMTAIRENEGAAHAAGKHVTRRRIEAFVIGAMVMGLAGAMLSQHLKLIEPTNTFDPSKMTFLVWVMLIAGGSGNNKGAIFGAFLVWVIWSASEIFINSGLHLFGELVSNMDISLLKTRAGYLRMVVIGLLLQYILQKYPDGIMPESRPIFKGN
jgi:branched-chain amino acid transport system permease protein